MSEAVLELAGAESLDAVINFLRKCGYKEAETALLKESGYHRSSVSTSADTKADATAFLESYQTSSSLFEPERYSVQYKALYDFITVCLDSIKAELSILLYPVFVHVYLSLICNGDRGQASDFMARFGPLQESYWQADIQVLKTVTTPDQLSSSDWFSSMREHPFATRLSQASFMKYQQFVPLNPLIKGIIDSHMHIEVYDGQPRSRVAIDSLAGSYLGETLLGVNRSKVYYGIPKDPTPAAVDDDGDTGGKDGTKDGGAGGEKSPKKKKTKKDVQAKKHRPDPNAPPPNRVPLPELNDAMKAEKQQAAKEISKRVKLGTDRLPSICLYTLLNAHHGVSCSDVSEDTSILALGYGSSDVQVWSLTPDKLKPLKRPTDLETLDKEADDVLEQMIDDNSAAESLTFHAHSGPVYGVSISPDRQLVLSASEDETIRLWSLRTWTNLVSYKADAYPIWDVKFSPHGYYFASGNADTTALLWTCDRNQPIRVFAGHFSDVNTVLFHPNSNYVASGSADRSVRLWDVTNGQCVRYFTGNKGSIQCLAFSPTGRILVAGDANGYLTMWDIGHGRLLANVHAHQGSISSLYFSREGAFLVTGGLDSSIRLFNMQSVVHDLDLSTDDSSSLVSPAIKIKPSDIEVGYFPTKSTGIVGLHFTRRNLLVGFGCFTSS